VDRHFYLDVQFDTSMQIAQLCDRRFMRFEGVFQSQDRAIPVIASDNGLLSRACRAVMTYKSSSRHREEESAAVVWVVRASGASQKTKRAVLLGLQWNWQK
jgi:hypothetical protein